MFSCLYFFIFCILDKIEDLSIQFVSFLQLCQTAISAADGV